MTIASILAVICASVVICICYLRTVRSLVVVVILEVTGKVLADNLPRLDISIWWNLSSRVRDYLVTKDVDVAVGLLVGSALTLIVFWLIAKAKV